MILMLAVLIFRWKLSGDRWHTLAIGLVFWCVYYLPDLFLLIGNGTLTASISFEYIIPLTKTGASAHAEQMRILWAYDLLGIALTLPQSGPRLTVTHGIIFLLIP